MKLTKTQVCLHIYEELLKGHSINLNELANQYSISNLSAFRDIQEIRAYLYNSYSKNMLVYDKKTNVYKLVTEEKK